jgi:hypothetical protein
MILKIKKLNSKVIHNFNQSHKNLMLQLNNQDKKI